MKSIKRILSLLLAMMIAFGISVSAQEENYLKIIRPSTESSFFDVVFGDVVDMYQFDVTQEQIYERMITTMLNENPKMLDTFFEALFASFDDYSEFYTADEFKNFVNNLEGVFGGIGVYLEKRAPYVYITGTLPDSPAVHAGVQAGDIVYAVDGEKLEGRSLEYVSYKLRGEIGTNVLVTLLRGKEEIDVVITRTELNGKTASYTVLAPDTGYIAIHSFASATAREVEEALAAFDKLGIKKIILDLRDNGGGYVESAIEIGRMFVPEGTIITHYTKANKVSYAYKSYLKKPKYKLCTLVNDNTASAAEILASALQDSGISKLVGTKTFGKAVTQSVFSLYADRMCKLTTGEYFTRNGKKINKVGITPDVTVENREVRMGRTDIEPLVFCSAFTPGETAEGISAYKRRLRYFDYNTGELDNVYSAELENAVYHYQSVNGITPTGVLDIITQIHIQNTTDELEVYIDNQLNEAARLLGSSYKGLSVVQ